MSEWKPLSALCQHCLGELEGRPSYIPGAMVMTGCEPMEYRHAATHRAECFTRHEAAPYTNWGQYKEYRKLAALEDTHE